MNLSCTIVLIVDEKHTQEILLYKDILKRCGVKYELFTCNDFPIHDALKKLYPSYSFGFGYDFPKNLNRAVSESTTDYIVYINVPFIAEDDWLKNYLNFLNHSEANCLIVPYLNYKNQLEKSEFLNPYGEILDIQSPKNPNEIIGMHIFHKNNFYNYGGFVGRQYHTLNECLIHYRKKCEYVLVYNQFLKTIRDEFFECKIENEFLQLQPVRDFTTREEIAFHNLDDYVTKNLKINCNKFAFDFIGVFGFRCNLLNTEQINYINEYAVYYNLKYEIKFATSEKENQIGNNLFVLFQTK